MMFFSIPGKQLLALADQVDPGMTKLRGELLFEMQAATVVLAQRALEEGKLTRFQAQVSYEELCFVIFFNGGALIL